MKRIWILAVFFAFVLSAAAQPQINLITDAYDALDVSGSVAVHIVSSGEGNIVFADSATEAAVEVNMKHDVLYIKSKTDLKNIPAHTLLLNIERSPEKITASKGARVLSKDTLHTDQLDIQAKSGSKIELFLEASSLDVNVVQGSSVILYGQTGAQNVQAKAWGKYLAYDLESRDSYVKATSGGMAKVIARRIINATSNGPSFVGYIGEPESTYIKTSLGGEIVNFKNRSVANDN